MPKLYSGREIVKTLKRAGFEIVGQKGSHVKLRGFWNGKLQTIIVPFHKEVAHGTFSSILTQSSMTKKEFEKFFK